MSFYNKYFCINKGCLSYGNAQWLTHEELEACMEYCESCGDNLVADEDHDYLQTMNEALGDAGVYTNIGNDDDDAKDWECCDDDGYDQDDDYDIAVDEAMARFPGRRNDGLFKIPYAAWGPFGGIPSALRSRPGVYVNERLSNHTPKPVVVVRKYPVLFASDGLDDE